MIIGPLIGLLFAYVKLELGAPEPQELRVVKLNVFEDQLIAHADPERRAVIEVRNVKIHPAGLRTFNLEGVRDPVVAPFISYDVVLARNDKSKLADVLPRITLLENKGAKKHANTYIKDRAILTMLDKLHESVEADNLDLSKYLDKLNELIEKIDKSTGRYASATPVAHSIYSWWETPKSMYWLYSAGGFVVIGLVFPSLIQLLTIAGYGKERKTPEDQAYLDRFKGGAEPEKAKAVIPVDAKEQLAQLEAELEAKLKAGTSDAPAPAPAAAPAKPAIAVLTGMKVEPAKTVEEKKAGRKGYGTDQGDFYPTEVHGKK